MKNNKRGSHVGVILSFAIFITFVMFLYVLVQPNLVDQETQVSALKNLQRQILQNVSDNLTTTGIKVEISGQPQSCLTLINFFEMTNMGYNLGASGENGELFEVYTSEDAKDLFIYSGGANLKLKDKTKTVIRLYNSSSFKEVTPPSGSFPYGHCAIPDVTYTLGYTNTREVVMDSKLKTLIEFYNRNDPFLGYIPLKDKFGLISDFGFNFTYQNRTTVGTTKQVSQSRAVEVLEVPILYASPSRIIESGSLNVRIW